MHCLMTVMLAVTSKMSIAQTLTNLGARTSQCGGAINTVTARSAQVCFLSLLFDDRFSIVCVSVRVCVRNYKQIAVRQ